MTTEDNTPTGGGRKYTLGKLTIIDLGDLILEVKQEQAALRQHVELALRPIIRPSYVNYAIAALPIVGLLVFWALMLLAGSVGAR